VRDLVTCEIKAIERIYLMKKSFSLPKVSLAVKFLAAKITFGSPCGGTCRKQTEINILPQNAGTWQVQISRMF
jgi:hypothetical protein